MIMGGKAHTLAEIQQTHTVGLEQAQPCGIRRKRVQRIGQPRRQARPDPDHQIGPLQHRRLGGAQRVAMRRGTGRHDQIRCANPRHHLGDQGMDRCNINRHARHIGQRRRAKQQGQSGETGQLLGVHRNPHM